MALSSTGCQQVPLKDNEWCADEGRLGADCFHTISDSTRTLDKPTWDTQRFGWVCTDTESFTNWKEAIDKFCAQYQGECTEEMQQNKTRIVRKIRKIRKKLGLTTN